MLSGESEASLSYVSPFQQNKIEEEDEDGKQEEVDKEKKERQVDSPGAPNSTFSPYCSVGQKYNTYNYILESSSHQGLVLLWVSGTNLSFACSWKHFCSLH